MASLTEIVGRVQQETDWAPTATLRTKELHACINEAELDVWGARSWVAAQGTFEFDGIPDWTPERFNSAVPPTVSVTKSGRRLEFSAPLTFLYEDASLLASKWVGQAVSLPTSVPPSGGSGVQITTAENYTILKVESPTVVWIDRPYEGITTAALTGWRFKWIWYRYPTDCLRPTLVYLADEPISSAPPIALRQLPSPGPLWWNDPVNTPSAWVEDDPFPIPAGGKLTVALNQPGARDDTHGLPTGRFYEVAWAWLVRGQLGAPGTPLVFSTGVAGGATFVAATFTLLEPDGLTLPLTSAPNPTEAIWPLTYEGLQKVLLVNGNIDGLTGERLGPPRWSVVNRRSRATTQADTDLYALVISDQSNTQLVTQDWQVLPSLPRVLTNEAGHQFRMWPRSDGSEIADPAFQDGAGAQVTDRRVGTRRFRMHYIRKPLTMCQPNDVPFPLPVELHDLVVMKATEKWARRIGRMDIADSAEARFSRAIDSARALKHQAREGYRLRRGVTDVGRQADALYGGWGVGVNDGYPVVTTFNLPWG